VVQCRNRERLGPHSLDHDHHKHGGSNEFLTAYHLIRSLFPYAQYLTRRVNAMNRKETLHINYEWGSPVIKGTSYKLNNHASITGKGTDLSIRHNCHTRCEAPSTSDTRFKASATKLMRSALFWDITQRIVVIPSEQPIGSIFKGQEVQEERDRLVVPKRRLRYPRWIQISASYTNGIGGSLPRCNAFSVCTWSITTICDYVTNGWSYNPISSFVSVALNNLWL